MTATVNGNIATSVRVRKPRVSAAHIDVELPEEVTLSNPVTVAIEGHEFKCSVVSQRATYGRANAFLVGGAGGLSKPVTAQHYNDVNAELIIGDILREVGEKLDTSSEIPAIKFGNWQRKNGQASHALLAITERCGLVFRSTDSGNIWVGTDAFTSVTPDVTVLDEDWETGAITVAADEFSELAKLIPGATFEGHRVEQVTHVVTETELRTIISTDSVEGSARDFLRVIRAGMASFAVYRCKVVAQNSDGTLQVQPEDATIAGRGLDKVPIREGAPGWETKVSEGAIVSVAFDGGQWDRPYACLWGEGQTSGVESMEFKPSGRGAPMVVVGDQLEIALPISLPLVGTVGGAPFAGTLIATTPLTGVITGPGNPKLLA